MSAWFDNWKAARRLQREREALDDPDDDVRPIAYERKQEMATTLEHQIADTLANVPQEDAETTARLVRAFENWVAAREYAVKERKRTSEQLAARIAQFAEAMHVGHQTTGDQVLKLSVVESRWQDLEDAREEKKQVGAACRDSIKASEQKIKDLIASAQSGQMTLFQSEAEAASDAGVDNDAGQS